MSYVYAMKIALKMRLVFSLLRYFPLLNEDKATSQGDQIRLKSRHHVVRRTRPVELVESFVFFASVKACISECERVTHERVGCIKSLGHEHTDKRASVVHKAEGFFAKSGQPRRTFRRETVLTQAQASCVIFSSAKN